MKKYLLLIEVFDKEEMIDSFYYDLNNICPLKLPDKLPYQGLEFYIKGSIENGFSFSPDGYEMWVKFSKEHDGKCITYLLDRSYTFYFKIREDNILYEMGMSSKDNDPLDKIDEFDRIKDFKKR